MKSPQERSLDLRHGEKKAWKKNDSTLTTDVAIYSDQKGLLHPAIKRTMKLKKSVKQDMNPCEYWHRTERMAPRESVSQAAFR